jgi:hypothetical protein
MDQACSSRINPSNLDGYPSMTHDPYDHNSYNALPQD